jgi:hypothetical protein
MIRKKYTCFFAFAILISFSASHHGYGNNQGMLSMIYVNQKRYFDNVISNKLDFKPIIDFASSGRARLYKANGFSFDRSTQYILLEGFVHSNGKYSGIMIYDDIAIGYYNSIKEGWSFFKFNTSNSDTLQLATGIPRSVIDKIHVWDTTFVNGLKHSVGSIVSDGFTFIASKIDNANPSSPSIQTIGFYEFE